MRGKYLFHKYSIFDVIDSQKEKLNKSIRKIDSSALLNKGEDDLIRVVYDDFKMELPIINEEEIYAAKEEAQVDVSRDPMRFISNRNRPFYMNGTRTTVKIPFGGDASYFDIAPSAYTTTKPFAEIEQNEIRLIFEQVEANGEAIKISYQRTLGEIRTYLNWLQDNANQFNVEIMQIIEQQISQRKSQIVANSNNLDETLGIPIKTVASASNTYSVPIKRKRLEILNTSTTLKTSSPLEPILADNEYRFILETLKNMCFAMEKNPNAYERIGEEDLRWQFLVQLNGQYEGSATGETFNNKGKTDILITEKGKNVFIGECKFWRGESVFLETIDQLLSYSSWRDTKTAILIFNRNKNFTEVLKTIENVTPKHRCCKRFVKKIDETTHQYVFRQPEDNNREMTVTVMAFNVPSNSN